MARAPTPLPDANRFTGSHTIGKIVFIDNLALFRIFCFLVGLRFILDPKAFMRPLHPPQDRFLGCLSGWSSRLLHSGAYHCTARGSSRRWKRAFRFMPA